MINETNSRADSLTGSSAARQKAIEAYEGARDRATDTLGQAPLLALAGGIAAGALIAALLPRTEAETFNTFLDGLKETARASADAALDAVRNKD